MAKGEKWVCRQVNGEFQMIPVGEAPVGEGAHAVHTDTMDALTHPCDGKVYDSKSEFRRVTKAHGCVEVGNEWKDKRFHPGNKLPPGRKETLIEAWKQAKEGKLRPPPVLSEAQAERELGPIRRWK